MGEWQEANGAASPEPSSAGAPPAAITAAIAAVDVDVDASVQQAVRAAMARRLDAVAAAAVDEVLDEPTLAALRLAADDAARLALISPAPAAAEQDDPPPLYYATLPAFVTKQLVPMYRRPLGAHGVTWCAEWWRHTEAIARLEALWRAWEHLRLDAATVNGERFARACRASFAERGPSSSTSTSTSASSPSAGRAALQSSRVRSSVVGLSGGAPLAACRRHALVRRRAPPQR